MVLITITDKCVACNICSESCPAEILVIKKIQHDGAKRPKRVLRVTEEELCYECRACEIVCPYGAILIDASSEHQTVYPSK